MAAVRGALVKVDDCTEFRSAAAFIIGCAVDFVNRQPVITYNSGIGDDGVVGGLGDCFIGKFARGALIHRS